MSENNTIAEGKGSAREGNVVSRVWNRMSEGVGNQSCTDGAGKQARERRAREGRLTSANHKAGTIGER